MTATDDRQLIEHYQTHGFPDDDELLAFVESFIQDSDGHPLHIPRAQVCPEHSPPATYLCDAFFERAPEAVCWANRGGGKTLLGALATFLDTVFKRGCATRILGGSQEQSKRVYEHLTGEGDGWGMVNEDFRHLLRGEMKVEGMVFNNLSNIKILTASSKSVRGAHPQKAKLDEIDEMDPRIYTAALSIPMSKRGIKASTHIYSTMHKNYGLMQQIVEEAPVRGYRLYKWCVMDVLERCTGRECGEVCPLWDDCKGRAQGADGHYPIELAITKKRQVPDDTWQSEYLCRIPSSEGLIYPDFDMSLLV
jgi:hypothetical protein